MVDVEVALIALNIAVLGLTMNNTKEIYRMKGRLDSFFENMRMHRE